MLEHEDAHAAQRTGRRRRGAALVALLAVLAAFLVLPAAAGAHAVLLSSEPASGAVLQTQPTEVLLRFNEPVETAGGAIIVAAGDGQRVDGGDIELLDGGRAVRTAIDGELAEGSYSVAWRVTSADAHVIQGSFVFSVGRPGPTYTGTLIDDAPRSANLVAGIGRAFQFAGLLVAIGIAAFLLAVWLPLARSAQERLGPALDPAADAFHRVATGVALAAGGALLGGALIAIPAQAWQTGGSLGDVLDTRFGEAGAVRLVLAPIAIVLVVLAARRPSRGLAAAALVALLPLAFLPGLSGHASTAGTPWAAELLDGIHVLAAGVWSGGLALLAVALGAGLARLDPEPRRPFLRGAVKRFTRLAVGAVAVLVATGTIAALRELDAVSELVDTRYGQVLTLKVLVVATALGIALLSRRAGPSFLRDVRAEAALLAVAIVLTAALTGLAPGANAAPPAPFALQQPIGPHTLTFDIAPARAGTANEVHVVVTNPVGQPAFDVRDARLVMGLPAAGITDLEVPLKLLTAGHWTGTITFPQPGAWQAALTVRRGTFDAETVNATVPVSR